MDFGSFIGGLGTDIGNFFGGIFNPKKKRPDQSAPQPTVQRPSSFQLPNQPQANNSVLQMPQSPLFNPQNNNDPTKPPQFNPLVLGGVNQQKPQQLPDVQQKPPEPTPTVQPTQPHPSFWNSVNDFTAQANDALLGGLTRGGANIVNSIATGFNPNETKKRTEDFMRTIGETDRNGQSQLAQGSNKNSTAGQWGQAVGGTEKFVAENAPFIAMPELAVAKDISLPTKIISNNLLGGVTGFTQGMAGGDSLKQDLENAVVGGTLGTGITLAAPALKGLSQNIFRRLVPSEVPEETVLATNVADGAVSPVESATAQAPEVRASHVGEPTLEPPTIRDPNHPIQPSASSAVDKPAITSPNRPAPTVQQPRPLFPQAADTVGVPSAQPMIVRAPEAPVAAPTVPTIDEATALAQKAIDEQATKPAPLPPESQVAPIEPKSVAEAKVAAAQAPPVSPEAVAADTAAQAASQAPTEEIAQSLSHADTKANQILDMARATLGDGGYAKLVQKVAHNSEAGNIPETLTPAEQAVLDAVKPHADAAVKKANDLRLTDADLGRRQQYLPTKAQDPLTEVTDVKSALEHGLTYAEKRANGDAGLTHEQRGTGAEQALRDMMRTHELLDHAPKDQLNEIASRRMTNDINSLIETDAEGKSTGLKLSDSDIQDIHEGHQYAIDAADHAKEIRQVAEANPSDKALQKEAKQAQKEADQAEFNQQRNVVLKARKTADERIQAINKSAMSGSQKAAARSKVKAVLANIEAKSHYVMSYTKSNMLSTPLGRIADQTGKLVTALEDNTVGRVGKALVNRSAVKNTGEKLFADNKTTRDVYNLLKGDKSLHYFGRSVRMNKALEIDAKDNPVSKASGIYRTTMTAFVESGSRYRAPLKNTISHFAAKAQAGGITDVNDIAAYVRSRANSAEWQRVYDTMYHDANAFTGVPTPRNAGGHGDIPSSQSGIFGRTSANVQKLAGSVKTGIQDGLEGLPLPDSFKRNLADSMSVNLVGFPKTMLNIAGASLDRATFGVGSFIKAARMDSSTEASRLTKAMLYKRAFTSLTTVPEVGAAGIALGQAGLVTGAYPSDPAERKRWQAEHIEPYSVNINGKWVDLSRYAPQIAIPLQIGAYLGTQKPGTANLPQALAQIFSNTVVQVSQNFGLDQMGSVLTSAGSFLSGKPDTSLPDQLAKFASGVIDSFVPLSSAVNQVGNAKDTYQRDTSGDNIGDTIKNNLIKSTASLTEPFGMGRESLPVKNDVFGNPLLQNGTAAPNNPVEAELHRLSQSGVEAYPQGTQGKNNDYKLKDSSGKAITLSADQQRSLDKAIGQDKEKQAYLVMTSPEYQNANDKTRGEMLSKTYSLDNSAVASQWAAQNKIGDVKATSEKVNNGLSPAYQQALTSYKLQGNKQKAWLDDNKNASNYYTALYENAKLNKTLTSKDNDLQEKSGLHYKAIAAQVDQKVGADHNLREMYKKVSETDLRKMLTPGNSEYNPKLATKLYKYDQARAKAGVSGAKFSDKQKYTLDAKLYGTKGGRRGGRGIGGVSGSDKFAFASMPTSLAGVGANSGSGSSYASDAPLFKPIADLRAPVAAIPRGRTISVKKGRLV